MQKIPSRAAPSRLRVCLTSVLVLIFLSISSVAQVAHAAAPPLAVTITDVTVFASADSESEHVGFLPGGSTVELTGESAPGFIAIVTDEISGWVPADQLSASGRPGIETAVTVVETPLLEAPFPDAGVIESITRGESVMLTGAAVGEYDAASRNGAGGWIDRLDILRKYLP